MRVKMEWIKTASAVISAISAVVEAAIEYRRYKLELARAQKLEQPGEPPLET